MIPFPSGREANMKWSEKTDKRVNLDFISEMGLIALRISSDITHLLKCLMMTEIYLAALLS